MDFNNFILVLFILVVPLVLIILCYRNYMKCLKQKLIFDTADTVEPFFGGITNWFTGNSQQPPNLAVSPGSFGNENLNQLEKKINDNTIKSSKFPPTELNGNSDDFKDSDNSFLNQKKPLNIPLPNNENKNPEAIFNKPVDKPVELDKIPGSIVEKSQIPLNQNIQKQISLEKTIKESVTPEKPNLKELLGSCQFYNDKCPDDSFEFGNFSIKGIGSTSILNCGNVQTSKPAKAVVTIKNNIIYDIHVIDKGDGYNSTNPPKVMIEGGKGNGGAAEAVVDDDGFISIIKVIHPGYQYSETPNIIIEAPFMNSSCHLCCKN